jgi:hypothetical protein
MRTLLGIVELRHDLAGGIDIVAACIGELDVAARPDEEPRAEMAFELRDFPADARQRRIQLAAAGRQAACVSTTASKTCIASKRSI